MNMKTSNETEIAQKTLQVIEKLRSQPLSKEVMSILDNIESEVLVLAKKVTPIKVPSCFINEPKGYGRRRPYYINGAHAGYINYVVEPSCGTASRSVGDVIDSLDNFISSRFIEEKAPSRKTYGCLRFDTADHRTLVNASAVVAISEYKHERGATAVVHLNSGREVDSGLSYDTLVTAYLDYLGRERGTIKSPAGV
ncbi:hypothetical protein [Enterobacter cancerogenus]